MDLTAVSHSLIVIGTVVIALASALLLWRTFASNPDRAVQRVCLWLAAVFFTYYGPFSVVHPQWPPSAWAAEVNANKDFKDICLAFTGMAVFTLSNVLDNLLRRRKDLSRIARLISPGIALFYLLAIAAGITAFQRIHQQVLSPADFSAAWNTIFAGTMLGMAWELLIALELKD